MVCVLLLSIEFLDLVRISELVVGCIIEIPDHTFSIKLVSVCNICCVWMHVVNGRVFARSNKYTV